MHSRRASEWWWWSWRWSFDAVGVGSGGGELGAGAGHVDEDLFEGTGRLGDLGDLDAVVERQLGHDCGAGAVQREVIAVDVGADAVTAQQASEVVGLWAAHDDGGSAPSEGGLDRLGGEQRAGSDDHEVI